MTVTLPPTDATIALPPVVVVARDATRRQALVELAASAGLAVIGAYPAWETVDAGAVVISAADSAPTNAEVPVVLVGPVSSIAGAGPRALLPAEASPGQLAAAVAAVDAGLSVQPPGMSAPPSEDGVIEEDLTPREHDVLELLADGLSNRLIATRLVISENTVKFHVASILAKLGAQSRAEAVMQAVRRGLLPL